jgi:hypothetical protein
MRGALGTEGWNVKQLAIGLCLFLSGVILCAVNWLGAAAAVPAVSEWSGRRINGAWQYVGYVPLIIGIVLLVISVILIISSVGSTHDANDPS